MQTNKATKKLVNDPKNCVQDALKGLVRANSKLKLLSDWNVVLRSNLQAFKNENKVALISGGGSGHEPFAGGYVGKGLLTGCVAGDVFTSPSTASISQALDNCYTPSGVLFVILNYTGDRLNFGKAVEIAKSEGKNVDMVVVGEDCALVSKDKSAGKRGLCGIVPIIKMAGAMSEENKSISEIKSFLLEATKGLSTISVSLSSCSIPGKPAGFTIDDDKFEFGLGIHGEAGVAQFQMDTASSITSRMWNHMKSNKNMPLMSGQKVAIIINNLGGTSNLELSVMTKEIFECLNKDGVVVKRCYVGTFITSLEMAGVSITVLILNDDRIRYLDKCCDSSNWPKSGTVNQLEDVIMPSVIATSPSEEFDEKAIDEGLLHFSCAKEICQVFMRNEEYLNELDRASGDGDTGTTFSKCAEALLEKLSDPQHVKLPVNNAHKFFLSLGKEIEKFMGGSSGALLSLFFTAAANAVSNSYERKDYINALANGITAVQKYGGASQGDRTMLDALCPALRDMESCSLETKTNELLIVASKAAREGANATIKMQASAGRASYVSQDHLVSPDPGAVAIALAFETLEKVFNS